MCKMILNFMWLKINKVDGNVKVSGEQRFIYYICLGTSGHWEILEPANKTIKVLVCVKADTSLSTLQLITNNRSSNKTPSHWFLSQLYTT